MATTLIRKVMLRIAADDGDTETKLDRISLKADEIGRKHPELKVRVDAAAASAKLSVLRKELKATADQADKSKISLKGIGSALADFATGGISGGIGQMSMFQKVMLGLNVATGLGEPLVAGLAVAVGGLSAGLVSAGAGLGVFGLVAKGAFAQVEKADKANKKLTGGLGQLQSGLKRATAEWNHFVSRNSSGVASIMSQGLGLLPKVFAAMQPFLAPTEKAIHGLVADLSRSLSSSGFKSFIDTFAKASGPMITNLGHAIGHIVVGIGGILRAFLPMAGKMTHGLDDITAKFAKWGTTLTSHSGFKSLMSMFKTDTPLAVNALKSLVGIIKNVVSGMTGLSTFSNSKMLLQIANPLLTLLKALSGNKALLNFSLYALAAFTGLKKMSNGITSVSNGLTAMKSAGSVIQGLAIKLGLMKAATTEAAVATEGETVAQTELDGAMDANPIGLIILAIAGLVIGIVELWKHSTGFRNFWKGAWKVIKEVAVLAWDDIKEQFKIAVTVIGATIRWFSRLPGLFHNWFFDVYHAIVHAWQAVYSFIRAAPGKILGFLASLPGKMLSLGKNIVMGLVHGIEAMFGAVGSAIAHLASLIPAGLSKILSIFSPSKVTHWHGQMIGQGLIEGMDSMHGKITATATRMGMAATPGRGRAGMAVAGGFGQQRVVVEFDFTGADQALVTAFKKIVRVRGGDPMVFGR